MFNPEILILETTNMEYQKLGMYSFIIPKDLQRHKVYFSE